MDGALPDAEAGRPTIPMPDTAHTRTIRRAIEALGGCERLAAALGASVAEVEAWAAGLAAPPPGAFLKAIDIVATGGLASRAQGRGSS